MALAEYEIEINGVPTTVQLSDEDAKAYGDRVTKVGAKAATPANKAAKPDNK